MQECIKTISKYKTIIQLHPKKYNKYRSGVHAYGNKFRSEVQYNKHKYGLGEFSSIDDAATAYGIAKRLVVRGLFLEVFNQKPRCKGNEAIEFWLKMSHKYCISVDF